MARTYGTLEVTFWDDPDARRLSHDAQRLYFYLRTSRHSNVANAYVLPLPYIEHDTGLSQEKIARALRELAAKPFALRDHETGVVFLPGIQGTTGNKIANSNVAKYVASQLLSLPDSKLKGTAIAELVGLKQFDKTVTAILGQWRFDGEQPSLPLAFHGVPEERHPAPAPMPPEPREKPRGTRLQPDWTLPEDYRSWAESKGVSAERIDREAAKFFTYFTGDNCKAPVKKNWLQAWQGWIDRALESAPSNGSGRVNGGNGEYHPPPSNAIDWEHRLSLWRKGKIWLPTWDEQPDDPGYRGPKP